MIDHFENIANSIGVQNFKIDLKSFNIDYLG
jgi:hypothetical protein